MRVRRDELSSYIRKSLEDVLTDMGGTYPPDYLPQELLLQIPIPPSMSIKEAEVACILLSEALGDNPVGGCYVEEGNRVIELYSDSKHSPAVDWTQWESGLKAEFMKVCDPTLWNAVKTSRGQGYELRKTCNKELRIQDVPAVELLQWLTGMSKVEEVDHHKILQEEPGSGLRITYIKDGVPIGEKEDELEVGDVFPKSNYEAVVTVTGPAVRLLKEKLGVPGIELTKQGWAR